MEQSYSQMIYVNNLLTLSFRVDEPQPHYTTIKTMYPHYVCSKSADGIVAYYERPGEIEIEQVRLMNKLAVD